MQSWEIRLKHERDLRDAVVLCGNKAPEKPDPEGGVFYVPIRVWKGPVAYEYLEKTGHSSPDFEKCQCKRTK